MTIILYLAGVLALLAVGAGTLHAYMVWRVQRRIEARLKRLGVVPMSDRVPWGRKYNKGGW